MATALVSALPASEGARRHVAALGLEAHPEGGFYRRWYTASTVVSADLPAARRGYPPGAERALASAIHYLLEAGGRSRLHRIRGDELWLWQGGGPIVVMELLPPALAGDCGAADGVAPPPPPVTVRRTVLGPDAAAGHVLSHAVPGGATFGAYVPAAQAPGYALVSCVVTPGFDFQDWDMHAEPELPAVLLAAAGAAAAAAAAGGGDAGVGRDALAVVRYLALGATAPLPE